MDNELSRRGCGGKAPAHRSGLQKRRSVRRQCSRRVAFLGARSVRRRTADTTGRGPHVPTDASRRERQGHAGGVAKYDPLFEHLCAAPAEAVEMTFPKWLGWLAACPTRLGNIRRGGPTSRMGGTCRLGHGSARAARLSSSTARRAACVSRRHDGGVVGEAADLARIVPTLP